jgi:hypothetical protein
MSSTIAITVLFVSRIGHVVVSILTKKLSLYQAVTDGRQTSLEAVETKNNVEASRKRSGRGRGSSGSGRGRGSKSNAQTRSQISPPTVSASNGQNENVLHKVSIFP